MRLCFECNRMAMLLVRIYYDDMYKHYDGYAKEQWICRSCLARRITPNIEDRLLKTDNFLLRLLRQVVKLMERG